MPHPLARPLLAALATATLAGCSAAYAVGIRLVYDRAPLPDANVRLGLPYVEGSDEPKHRLNLFLPVADSVRRRPWPVVVFVHGGGWTEGDRDYTFGGEDVYNNVGRYLAARGVGAVNVSYRLLPAVGWREQVADVAKAVAWAHRNVAAFGGDPRGLFLMGHSAGGQLVTRVALDPDALGRAGVPAGVVCGVIPVSAAGLDLTDRQSFVIARNYDYYARRFGPPGTPLTELPPEEPLPWQAEASPLRFVGAGAPPFLILYAGGDYPALIRQAGLLDGALRAAGAESRVVVVPGQSHTRIVPTLSRDDRTAGPAVLDFVRRHACG